MATSIKQARALGLVFEEANWEILDAVGRLTGHRAAAAQAVRARMAEALSHDENAVAWGQELGPAQRDAVELLTRPEPPPPPPGREVVEIRDQKGLGATAATEVFSHLTKELTKDPSARLDLSWTLTREVKQK